MDAGWKSDPAGRHALRYWSGSEWTRFVSDGAGERTIDEGPVPEVGAVPPAPPAASAFATGASTASVRMPSDTPVFPAGYVPRPPQSTLRGCLPGIVVLVVIALAIGVATSMLSGGDGPFEQSMVRAERVVSRGTQFEAARVIAYAPGRTDAEARSIAESCVRKKGDGRANGAVCWVFTSQVAYQAAEVNALDVSMKAICWQAMAASTGGRVTSETSTMPMTICPR